MDLIPAVVEFIVDSHTANVKVKFFKNPHHKLLSIRLKIKLHFPLRCSGGCVPVHHRYLTQVI